MTPSPFPFSHSENQQNSFCIRVAMGCIAEGLSSNLHIRIFFVYMGIRWNFVFGFEMSVFLRDTWRGCANSFVIERRSHLPITSSGRHVCATPKTWGVSLPIGWLIWYNHTMRVNMRLYILFTHILYTLPPECTGAYIRRCSSSKRCPVWGQIEHISDDDERIEILKVE